MSTVLARPLRDNVIDETASMASARTGLSLPDPALIRARWSRLLHNREALTVLLFAVLSPALGLVANRLLTQAVAPVALGELYLYMNLGLWLTIPATSAFVYLMRHWGIARARGAELLFARGAIRGLLLQAVICLTGALAFAAFGLIPLLPALVLALTIHGIGGAAAQIFIAIPGLERRRVLAGFLGLLSQPVRLIALWAGALLFLARPTGDGLLKVQAVYSLLLGLLAAALFLRWLKRLGAIEGVSGGDELTLRSFATFSAPYLFTAVLTQVANSAERWGLARFQDPAATALFVQGVGLSTAIAGAFTQVLNTYYTPIISTAAAVDPLPLRGARKPVLAYLVLTGLALGMMVACVAFLSGPLTVVLFGPRYAAVGPLLPWTACGAALFAGGQALAMVPFVTRDAIGQNVARSIALVTYSAALILLPHVEQAALVFSKLFAAGNGLYLLLMLGVVLVQVRAHRQRRAQLAGSFPSAS